MEENIIPFGKYKGKPIETLATDKEYTQWLLAQSWFREKNINLYNVVINNFREPENTPEHNKMQIKFLDLDYRLKFAFYIDNSFFKYNIETINSEIQNKLISSEISKEIATALKNPDTFIGIQNKFLLESNNPQFEKIDVAFNLKYGTEIGYRVKKNDIYSSNSSYIYDLKLYKELYFEIEIKPTISDDFPSILRQMKASMPVSNNKVSILFVNNYTGISATKEQLIQYFKTQGYLVIFESEIESIILPEFDKEFFYYPKTKEMVIEIMNN